MKEIRIARVIAAASVIAPVAYIIGYIWAIMV